MRALILLTDDVEREKARIAFETAGWTLDFATTPSEAEQKLSYVSADFVLAECEADLREADELMRGLRAKNATELVIALLVSRPMDVAEAITLGAEAVFRRRFEAGAAVLIANRLMLQPEARVKRQDERVVCSFPLVYRDHITRKLVSSRVLNLSISGMSVEVPKDPLPTRFDVLSFAFRIEPEGWEVAGKGLIRWVREEATERATRGFSVEFFDLTDLDHRNLAEFVKIHGEPKGPREFEIE